MPKGLHDWNIDQNWTTMGYLPRVSGNFLQREQIEDENHFGNMTQSFYEE